MKKFGEEFRDFILRGNMIDLAIGIIIGGAFSTVVTSLVNDIIMPPIGVLLGGADFSDLFVVLKEGAAALPDGATLAMAQEAGAATLNYGLFINSIINLLIIALSIFLVIRAINRMQERFAEEEEAAAATEKPCPFCATPIPVEATRCPHCTSQLELEAS